MGFEISQELFSNYIKDFVSNKAYPIIEEAKKKGITECIVYGPPQAGKSQIQNHLEDQCTNIKELTIGFTDVKIQQDQGNSLNERVTNFLKSLSPIIKEYLETEKVDLNKLHKNSQILINMNWNY